VKGAKTSQELLERALALQREGRARDAEPYYRKVILRNVRHDRALFGLSVVLLETGRLEEAARHLERARAPRRPASSGRRLAGSALGDAPGFARELEAAFRTAWRRYCAGR